MSPFPASELERIAKEFRGMREEQRREGRAGSWRRRFGHQMQGLEQRFEQMLSFWVPGVELQDAWREHLHRNGPVPAQPALRRPPWFVGRSEAGSEVEVGPLEDGGCEIRVQGQLTKRDVHMPALDLGPSGWSMRLDRQTFLELFRASAEAVHALSAFVASAGPLLPAHARALLDDGLIDWNFGITDRGRRLLGRALARG